MLHNTIVSSDHRIAGRELFFLGYCCRGGYRDGDRISMTRIAVLAQCRNKAYW